MILLLGWNISGVGGALVNIDPFLAQERTCHQNQSEMRNGDHVRFTVYPQSDAEVSPMIFVEDSYNII